MGLFSYFFGKKKSRTQTTSLQWPFRIADPRIGFLNLQGVSGKEFAESDQRALEPLFRESITSDEVVPACDVLFIYCTLDAKGRVVGSSHKLRELFELAGAYVAVVASENSSENFKNAMSPRTRWRCNYTLVLERHGDKFAQFFRSLFGKMFHGTSMVTAWVELCPQGGPGSEHHDAPGTVMIAEAGHIVFGQRQTTA